MKTLFIMLLFTFIGVEAQQVSFSEINSKNILQLLTTPTQTPKENATHATEILQVGNQNKILRKQL